MVSGQWWGEWLCLVPYCSLDGLGVRFLRLLALFFVVGRRITVLLGGGVLRPSFVAVVFWSSPLSRMFQVRFPPQITFSCTWGHQDVIANDWNALLMSKVYSSLAD